MIDGRNFVVQDILVVLVEINALLHDSLIVPVQRQARRFEDARADKVAGLNLQNIVTAVAVLVDPSGARAAAEARRLIGRPVTAVGVDAAGRVSDRNKVGDRRANYDFHRFGEIHHLGHAGENAGRAGAVALAAGLLRLDARLEYGLIFASERRLLGETHRLVWIPWIA